MLNSYGFSDWYEPNAEALEKLNQHKNLEIVIVHGQYCGDCQYTMPLLNNILKQWPVKVTEAHVTQQEKAQQHDSLGLMKKYNITRIPTIILLKDGKEVQRVVEAPNETIEQDFAKLL